MQRGVHIFYRVTDKLIDLLITQVLNPAEADVDPNRKVEDDDEEDVDQLLEKLPSDCRQFQELYMGCQGCILLLGLKQHLKDNYGFTDA